VLTFVILTPENVKGIMLTTARDAHRHAEAVLKNVEGWLVGPFNFFYFCDLPEA
jgi:hypothetical protein